MVNERGDPLERRKRAVKRGRLALDALDELKIGLLGGAFSSATLTKPKRPPPISSWVRAMRNWTPCWVKSSFGSRSRSPRWPRARAFQEERDLAKAGWKPAFRPKMRQCDNARMLAAKAGPRFRTAV